MKTSSILGLLMAFTSSLCCVLPLLALVGGFGGMITSLNWLEPFRPYTVALSLGALGWAWYGQLKPRSANDCHCDTPTFWKTRRFLGLLTGITFLLLTFPTYAHWFRPDSQLPPAKTAPAANRTIAYVSIRGMTCAGCEDHVNRSVRKLSGITDLRVSYAGANAVVGFNPKQTTIAAIQQAITATGYTVTAIKTTNPK